MKRNSNLPDFFQLNLHLFSYFRIQGAKRLVKKKRFLAHLPAHGQWQLAAAVAGEQGDISFFETLQAYHFQHFGSFQGSRPCPLLFRFRLNPISLPHSDGEKGYISGKRCLTSLLWRQLEISIPLNNTCRRFWLEACNNERLWSSQPFGPRGRETRSHEMSRLSSWRTCWSSKFFRGFSTL